MRFRATQEKPMAAKTRKPARTTNARNSRKAEREVEYVDTEVLDLMNPSGRHARRAGQDRPPQAAAGLGREGQSRAVPREGRGHEGSSGATCPQTSKARAPRLFGWSSTKAGAP